MDHDKNDVRDNFFKVIEELAESRDMLHQREKLIEAGFEFFDDDAGEKTREILEEQAARPKTERQWKLVKFFEGKDEPSQDILAYFIAEKYSDDVTYPLIRRYFRQASSQLKELILYGLEQVPWNTSFLNDLVFFNEFKPDLKELIRYYSFACKKSPNKVVFKELAKDFYESTQPYGYNAFWGLMQDETIGLDKKEIIAELKRFFEESEKAVSF